MGEPRQGKYYGRRHEHARAFTEEDGNSIFVFCDCAGGGPLDVCARSSKESQLTRCSNEGDTSVCSFSLAHQFLARERPRCGDTGPTYDIKAPKSRPTKEPTPRSRRSNSLVMIKRATSGMKNVGRYRKKAARGIVPRCSARCSTLVDVTDMKNRANRKDVVF